MLTVGCASTCIAHTALAHCEEMKKQMQLQKCNWQQNSEKLKKLRDRALKTKPQS